MTAPRRFEAYDPAVGPLKEMPLIVGITGPSFSGKSFSSERIAQGIARVYGGKVYHIDTENDRALELHKRYGGPFEFQHVPFPQPASPEQYEQAVRYCLAKPDCGVIVIDQMTHEHISLLNMMEEYMERKNVGDDWAKRDRLIAASQIIPKAQRKRLNELITCGAIRPDGSKVPIILLYRARDKSKPGKPKAEGGDGKWVHQGWQAESTSDLPYNMTARFLLPPASDGHPNLRPDTEWEKMEIKQPLQFRGWFTEGFQLTEEIGERLARWAKGSSLEQGNSKAPAPRPAGQVTTQADHAEALDGARAQLQRLTEKADRNAAMEAHWTASGWKAITAMDPAAIRAGAASLARELDGLERMKLTEVTGAALDDFANTFLDHKSDPIHERQPGEDD